MHSNYEEYSQGSGPEEILGEDFQNIPNKKATEFKSHAFINQGNGEFSAIPLPEVAQLSPIMAIVTNDFNQDGNEDLLLFGNNYGYRTDFGRADAKPITLLLGNGDGTFNPTKDHLLNTNETWGEYRNASKISIAGEDYVLAIKNNSGPTLLKLKSNQ